MRAAEIRHSHLHRRGNSVLCAPPWPVIIELARARPHPARPPRYLSQPPAIMHRLLTRWATYSLLVVRLLDSGDVSASTSTSNSGSAASADVGSRDTSGDTCGYYAAEPGSLCRSPRTCYDCLNVALESEPQGCLLSQFGVCESMSYYDASLDFRADGSMADSGSATNFSGGWFHMFPSTNTSYCEAADPACVECDAVARNLSAEDSFMAQTTKFCVGASDCVCVLSCEPSVWAARTADLCEATPEPSTVVNAYSDNDGASASDASVSSTKKKSHTTALVWITVVTVALPLALVIGFYVRYVRRPRGRTPLRPSLSPGNQLELAGWRALHEQLVEQQKADRGADADDSRQIAVVTISPVTPAPAQ